MDLETLAGSTVGKVLIRLLAAVMESPFRYRFLGPLKILQGTDILPGQDVLEVGCGTGYFTVPVGRLLGPDGHLVAIDVIQDSIELVSRRVQAAGLQNTRVVKADACRTELPEASFDLCLLLGVIPAPMLPLPKLLSEMHRLLKPGSRLAVWPPVPGWLPGSIVRSNLFTLASEKNGVHNFDRVAKADDGFFFS